MSLVGRLRDASVGTLVELYTHTDESVAGYITAIKERKIQLSQNNPSNSYNVTVLHHPLSFDIFEGKKWYNLEGFDRYMILRLPSTADEKFKERMSVTRKAKI